MIGLSVGHTRISSGQVGAEGTAGSSTRNKKRTRDIPDELQRSLTLSNNTLTDERLVDSMIH